MRYSDPLASMHRHDANAIRVEGIGKRRQIALVTQQHGDLGWRNTVFLDTRSDPMPQRLDFRLGRTKSGRLGRDRRKSM